jgi:hypothetical protein
MRSGFVDYLISRIEAISSEENEVLVMGATEFIILIVSSKLCRSSGDDMRSILLIMIRSANIIC